MSDTPKCPRCGSRNVSTSLDYKIKKGLRYAGEFAIGYGAGYLLGGLGLGSVAEDLVGDVNLHDKVEKEYECNNCGHIWKGKAKTVHAKKPAQKKQQDKSKIEQPLDHYWSLRNQGRDEEAFQYALSNKDKDGCEAFYLFLGESSYPEYDKALEFFNSGVDLCVKCNNQEILLKILYGRAQCFFSLGNYKEARKDAAYVYYNIAETLVNSNNYPIKKHAREIFQESDRLFVEHFLDLEWSERQYIFITDNLSFLYQNRVLALDINNLPKIEFPYGVPAINELYCAVSENEYCPPKECEEFLLLRQLIEYSSFLKSIGASKVSIQPLDRASKECMRFFSKACSTIGQNKEYRPWGPVRLHENRFWYDGDDDWRNLFIDRNEKDIYNYSYTFSLSDLHYITEEEYETVKNDISYWINEPHKTLGEYCDWNKTVGVEFSVEFYSIKELPGRRPYCMPFSLQIEGKEYVENIGTVVYGTISSGFISVNDNVLIQNKSGAIFTDKCTEIYIDESVPKAIYGDSVGLVLNNTKDNDIEIGGVVSIWEHESEPIEAKDSLYSSDEKEFLEMYQEYAADGEISERDRRMLDKFRVRCGISEDRARELEASCSKPQLSEVEQEYLEMFKEYAADGEISERDRKMLNKMRDRMGISEERAKEIEQY